MRKYFWIIFVPATVLASSWNSWQLFQPSNRNYLSRVNSGPVYSPGYPADASNVEPDVVAQWLFDEGSGNIVDEVSGITLTKDMNSAVYGVTATGPFSGVSPGIKAAYAMGEAPIQFIKSTATPSLDIGSTTSVTIEAYFSVTRNNATPPFWGFVTYDNAGEAANLMSLYVYSVTATNNLAFYVRSSDNTAKFAEFTIPQATLYNGDTHKIRAVWNRGTNTMEVFFNGDSIGSVDASGLSGKTLTCNKIRTHGIWLSEVGPDLTMYSLRISYNATNNSGGPGGG